MTNAEKYMTDIINDGGFTEFAMSIHGKIGRCSTLECKYCRFKGYGDDCYIHRLNWLDEKYTYQLTDFEIELLRNLDWQNKSQIFIVEDDEGKINVDWRKYDDDYWDNDEQWLPINNLKFKGVPRDEWLYISNLI